MSRKPAPPTHRGGLSRPFEVILHANPCGGFSIRGVPGDYGRISTLDAAAFSTLEEALEWLRVNMARPAEEKLPA